MGDPRRVIYGWEEDRGLVLEREDRLDAQHELGRRVAHTKTFGDLKRLAEFDDLFDVFVENAVEEWEKEHGPGMEPPDDAPVTGGLSDALDDGDILPSPEILGDADRDIRSWLRDEVVRLAEIGGASPGGNVDTIEWPERSVGERVLEILREHGFELIEDRERVRRMWEWPDAF
jgi:hypothetical protein